MKRDDIIRMAREADLLEVIDDAYQERGDWHPFVERFAALVAAAEREKLSLEVHSCSPFCERPACVAVRKAVAAEREECAKVLDANAEACVTGGIVLDVLLSNAAAIRARGQV